MSKRDVRHPVRRAAFAGRWYAGDAADLQRDVDVYLADGPAPRADIRALVSPHAGLMYSGPVAGHGYAAVSRGGYDVVVLVGPSHYKAFSGVAVAAQRIVRHASRRAADRRATGRETGGGGRSRANRSGCPRGGALARTAAPISRAGIARCPHRPADHRIAAAGGDARTRRSARRAPCWTPSAARGEQRPFSLPAAIRQPFSSTREYSSV